MLKADGLEGEASEQDEADEHTGAHGLAVAAPQSLPEEEAKHDEG